MLDADTAQFMREDAKDGDVQNVHLAALIERARLAALEVVALKIELKDKEMAQKAVERRIEQMRDAIARYAETQRRFVDEDASAATAPATSGFASPGGTPVRSDSESDSVDETEEEHEGHGGRVRRVTVRWSGKVGKRGKSVPAKARTVSKQSTRKKKSLSLPPQDKDSPPPRPPSPTFQPIGGNIGAQETEVQLLGFDFDEDFFGEEGAQDVLNASMSDACCESDGKVTCATRAEPAKHARTYTSYESVQRTGKGPRVEDEPDAFAAGPIEYHPGDGFELGRLLAGDEGAETMEIRRVQAPQFDAFGEQIPPAAATRDGDGAADP